MSFFCDPYSFYDLFPNLHFDFTAPNCNEILTQPLAYSRDRDDTPQHVQTPLKETLSTDTSSDLSPPTYALYPQCSLEEPQQQLFAPQQSDNFNQSYQQQLSSAHYARSYVQAPMVTRIDTEDRCASPSRKRSRKDGKCYPCPECGKTFTSSSNLAVHAMIHTGMKPFKCELCPWAFRQKAHLQKHMRHIHKMTVAK